MSGTRGTTTLMRLRSPHTGAIPNDFEGIMGVPITFLDKYNPDQFEIVAL